MTKEEYIKQIKELAVDFWTMNLHNGTFEENLRSIVDKREKAMNVVRSCEQLHLCKYVKREGESCTLNNNCKYPNCE